MPAITDILNDYLSLCNRYPVNTPLTKQQRKERHSELIKWSKKEYQEMPFIEEIKTFMRTNYALKFEQPFFIKAVMPCVFKDIKEGRIESLRFLFECNGMDCHQIGTTTDYIYIFCAWKQILNTIIH